MTPQAVNPFLTRSREGAVVVLRMDRPETYNALSDDDAIEALRRAFAQVNADRSVKVMVLTGSGAAFSSGGNLKTIREQLGGGLPEAADSRYAYRDGVQRLVRELHELEVPTIAAVNGHALGVGNDLACLCDIRIASDAARFACSFIKLGLIPGDGGAWLLPRVVGRSRAHEMAFTGRTLDAAQALEWGLVSRVVAPERLMPEAMALAQEIAAQPGHALRMTKRLLREGEHSRLETVLELSAAMQALAHRTQEHEAALERFAARTTSTTETHR